MRIKQSLLYFLMAIAGAQMSAASSITAFLPASGQPGNIITITGTGLSATSAIEFNPNNPTPADFIVISDTILQTVVPLGATTGPLGLTIGATTITTSSNFLVAPAISSFIPPSGAAGTTVAIFGANFVTGATTVKFAGSSSVAGTVASQTQVNATVPVGTTNGPITVTTSAGSATSTNGFIVSTAPIVTDFSPTIGINLSSVVIDGANFVNGGTTVKFNGTVSASVSVVSTTQLHAVVPNGAKTGPISVTANGATFTTSSNFTTASGLVVTGFNPPYGKAGVTSVNITGVGLQGTATAVVKFNGTAATVTGETDGLIQAVVPVGAITGAISVSNSKGAFTTTSNFTVLTGPLVTDFSPTIGPAGTSVVVDGLNFTAGAPIVKFNGVVGASKVTSDTQLTATVPSGAGIGPIAVTIGSSTFDTSSNFTETTTAPYITSFTPTNAVRGEPVTINGANFSNLQNPAVKFNGVAASNAPVEATIQLTAYVPASATTGFITVSSASGTGASPSIIYLQPWITNFTPTSGWVYSNLTIVGRNFTNASSLRVGGVSYNFKATTTQIVASVPTNAVAGPVTITTPGGIIISSNSFAILPNIFGFSPIIGPPNTVVTITGTSLSNVTSLLFGGGTPTAPLTTSFGEVTAAVPSNALTGPITLYTPAGNATTASNFTVTGDSQVTLTKTANTQLAAPGENVVYTLLLTNIGPSIITSVVVTDSLPGGLMYLSSSSSVGSITFTNPTVYWSMPPLTNRTSASATITATATASSLYNNVAGVSFAEGAISGGFHVATSGVYFVSASARTLNAIHMNAGVVISWPATGLDFGLQDNTNLLSTNWNSVNVAPTLLDGTNYITNPITSPGEFFRLKIP